MRMDLRRRSRRASHQYRNSQNGSVLGHPYDDGSYVTPVYRWELNSALDRKQIQKIIDKSGLYGLAFGDDFVEAYHVGSTDQSSIDDFIARADRAHELLSKAASSFSTEGKRLWSYGHGEGAIPYGRIHGDLPDGQATNIETAQRVTTGKRKAVSSIQQGSPRRS